MRNFRDTRTSVEQVLNDGRATVLRNHANTLPLSGEKIKLNDIHTNVMLHSQRMLGHCLTNENENKLDSWESRETLSRMSRDCRICHINVHSMRLQGKSFVYIVSLCREIVANYSRTIL